MSPLTSFPPLAYLPIHFESLKVLPIILSDTFFDNFLAQLYFGLQEATHLLTPSINFGRGIIWVIGLIMAVFYIGCLTAIWLQCNRQITGA